MHNLIEVASVPIITAIVYVILAVYKKATDGKGGVWANLTPLWAALLGAVLGIVAFYTTPGLLPAENVLAALLVGIASGLTATGVNQVCKQLSKAAKNSTASAPKDNADDNT